METNIYLIFVVLVVAIVIIIIPKKKITSLLPFFKKGNVYQNVPDGDNNITTMANGDNASAKNIIVHSNINFQKDTPPIDPLTEDDINKLSNWVNSNHPVFNRTDDTMAVRFTLGKGNNYVFNPKTESRKITTMESSLKRMKENGYIEEDTTKNTKHKWYKLTEKAFDEFNNN